ncbi:MAG: hypothetical protein HY549_09680 [Elusimicrobia bacterium]|nr:hypothetical protein [Elusimicrobiota bacterium]
MSDRDPYAPLKGIPPEEKGPRPDQPIGLSSTCRPNVFQDNNTWPDSPPEDKDIADPKFDILRMDMMLRGPGELPPLGPRIGLTGAALVQSWREEKNRRNK